MKKTLYVSRPVENWDDIKQYYINRDVSVDRFINDPHITLIYSRKAVEWDSIPSSPRAEFPALPQVSPSRVWIPVMESRHETFKWRDSTDEHDVAVLCVESEFLRLSHQRFIDAGCSYDFDQYRPHITLTHSEQTIAQLQDVPPYQGWVILGDEQWAPVRQR